MKKSIIIFALLAVPFVKANAQIYNAAPYCGVTVTEPESALEDAITKVQFNTLNRTITPSDTNYTYYNGSVATTLNRGASYPLTINYIKGDGEPMIITVYIDYNHNNVFDSDEIAYNQNNILSQSFSATFTSSGTITIPNTALTGTTRMRILNVEEMISDSVVANPCTGTVTQVYYPNYGEAIDYDITIKGPTDVGVLPTGLSATLYPNPATNIVYLPAELAGSNIIISDMLGRVIEQYNNANNSLDLHTLNVGTYMVRIIKDEKVYNQKLSIIK